MVQAHSLQWVKLEQHQKLQKNQMSKKVKGVVDLNLHTKKIIIFWYVSTGVTPLPLVNNFLGLPDLEQEAVFDIDHNESMSSSSVQNGEKVKNSIAATHHQKPNVPFKPKDHLKLPDPPGW